MYVVYIYSMNLKSKNLLINEIRHGHLLAELGVIIIW